jgi:2-keto-4-pentenoate hydratase/2-oxohepta-3-ene-1,7-dioic acid hydratase in catechol pathway
MRFANIRLADGRRTLAVRHAAGPIIDASKLSTGPAISIRQAWQRGEVYIRELAAHCQKPLPRAVLTEADIAHYLPTCEADAKVFCVGLNYASHAEELGQAIPKQPSIFSRYGTTCVGHGQPILLPKSSAAVDWEGELALVVGKPIKYVGEANAIGALAGVTCFNDVSMRDFQDRLPRITLAKNFDESGPIGPWLVTMDEVGDIGALTIETRVNGHVMQRASTKEFIFSVPFLIDLVSQVCALHSGDVIATGTPAGVAWRRKPPNYLKDGDVVEVEIERVGTLRNVARAET